jgi:histidine ammonia-lyase
MICEYSAASAVAELAQRGLPAALGWTTLSLGHEDGASFATQSAWAAWDAVAPLTATLAAELVVAARAIRMTPWADPGLRSRTSDVLAGVVDMVLDTLPGELGDHDMGADLGVAAGLLPLVGEASLRAAG